MTRQKLFIFLMKVGQFAMLLGISVTVRGLLLSNPTIIWIGCVTLFMAAYVMIFSQVKSF